MTLTLFFLFRVLLIILNIGHIRGRVSVGLVIKTFVFGLGNDLLALMVLFLPAVLIGALHPLLPAFRRTLTVLAGGFTALAMQLALMISSLDVPFSQHFFSRLTSMVFNWIDQPGFLVRMVIEESRFRWFVVLFAVLSLLIWVWMLLRLSPLLKQKGDVSKGFGGRPMITAFSIVPVCILMWSPVLRWDHFTEMETDLSSVPVLEKISQNPVLTFYFSLDSRPFYEKMRHSISLNETAARLSVELRHPVDFDRPDPLIRSVPGQNGEDRFNIVLVFMESISMDRMQSGLMPRLVNIASSGTSWTRFYASGVHTYTGIYSTLCAYPVQLRRHAMKWRSAEPCSSLAAVLGQNGYGTLFFTTHDQAFDNMGGFLRENGFQRVVHLDDYGVKGVSTFGVPDHVMFDRALDELDAEHARGPFLAVLLTASNHAPYRLPKTIPFRPVSPDMPRKMIEYSDWALGRFMDEALTRDWGRETLFVFVGDHGASGDGRFVLPVSMVHVPMVMVGPGIPAGRHEARLGSQLDVKATVLGRLGLDYHERGLGVDLFENERRLAVFCSDEYLGCTDGEYWLSFNLNQTQRLRRLADPLKEGPRERMQEMRATALAYWRAADWLVSRTARGGVSKR